MRNVSDTSFRENRNTHFMHNNFFPPKIVPFMRYCGKLGTAGQVKDDSVTWHRKKAICMPENKGKNTDTHS